MIPYPEWMPKRLNGCSTPCDMFDGPCACGATHNGRDHIARLREEIKAGIFKPRPELLKRLFTYVEASE